MSATGMPAHVLVEEPINILIVDDEPRNLTVLETVLHDPSYRLVRAGSADKALMALVEEEFALIVMDINMPDMSGFELAKLIKERRKTANVPIIFLTAYYNEDHDVLEGYGTGAVDYLHKPVNAAILRSKVAIFASMHRNSRQLNIANRALLAEVGERREAQSQLRELNETLEMRVGERTAELTQIEQTLRDMDQKKDRFIATLAHELRNPLAPIRNAVNVMRRGGTGAAQIAWCRDVIDRQISQMSHLLEDLLDVSRITQTKLRLRREMLDLMVVLEQAIEIARPVIDAAGQSFSVTFPPERVVINGDLTRLSQVVSNLLINASKYTDGKGAITLSARVDAGQAVVTVKDTGIGIAAENLPQVFEMFGQVSHMPGRAQDGLGIGLSLAKGLVDLHDGRLVASSDGAGEGSEFTVYLPVATQQQVARHMGGAPAESDGEMFSGWRILVVDDLQDSADSLAMLLQAMGNDVQVAYGGKDAVEVAGAFKPDLAFIDLGMPNVNGYEACRLIRAEEWGKDIVLVAQTGWGQDDDRRRTRDAGFDYHLVKPLDREGIDGILQNMAARARSSRVC